MKIIIPQYISDSTRNIMRSLGYFENFDRHTGKTSYIRRISRQAFYPRFHVYISENQAGRVIDIHLDQKQPSYAGAHAHNAEYDSEVVKREGERMRGILGSIKITESAPVLKEAAVRGKKGFWDRVKEIFNFY